jgi:hypothetical protein
MKPDNAYRATLASARARTLWLSRGLAGQRPRPAIVSSLSPSSGSPGQVPTLLSVSRPSFLAESIPFLIWGLLRTRLSSSPSIRGLILLDVLRACLVAAMVFLPHGHSAAGAVLGLTAVGAVFRHDCGIEPAFRAMLPQLPPPRHLHGFRRWRKDRTDRRARHGR